MIIKNAYVPDKGGVTKKDLYIDNNGYISKANAEDNVIYDADGKYVIPGFIDGHTHGFRSFNSEVDSEGLKKMALEYAKRGTLGFFATIGPRSYENYLKYAEEYRKAFLKEDYPGARFLGIHLEGPFLNPEKCGAFNPKKFYDIDLKKLEYFLNETKDVIKVITIAPEMNNAIEAIKIIKDNGIYVSMGHTNAALKEAKNGIEAGASQLTHTFNAMRGFNHREPGILGAAFLNEDIYCELIADGVHVSREVVKILMKIKGTERIMAVSDGGTSCGDEYPDGYKFEDGEVIFNGAVYCEDGVTLCGSTRDLYNHLKSFVNDYGLSLFEAVNMTSSNATRHFKLDWGIIDYGYKANLLILDKDLDIKEVIINGEILKYK